MLDVAVIRVLSVSDVRIAPQAAPSLRGKTNDRGASRLGHRTRSLARKLEVMRSMRASGAYVRCGDSGTRQSANSVQSTGQMTPCPPPANSWRNRAPVCSTAPNQAMMVA